MNGFMSLTPGAPGAAPQQRQPMPPQMPGRGGAMPPGPPQGRPAMSGGRPIQAGAPMPGGPSPMPMPQPAAQPLHPQAGGFMDLSPGPVPGAQQLAQMGRRGDTELAHVNPAEKQVLKRMGGSGAINPQTGLREYAGGTMLYGDQGFYMSDGSPTAWEDTGSSAAPAQTKSPMLATEEGGTGYDGSPEGPAPSSSSGPNYQGLYDQVAANPDGAAGSFVRDQISKDQSQSQNYGFDWNKATGWTDADYAKRGAEMANEVGYSDAAQASTVAAREAGDASRSVTARQRADANQAEADDPGRQHQRIAKADQRRAQPLPAADRVHARPRPEPGRTENCSRVETGGSGRG